jgi:hypothetical protein
VTSTPIDPTLPAWNKQLAAARLSELSDIRATAEKWSGSITALVGAAATASVIVVPKALKDFQHPHLQWVAFGVALAAALAGLVAVGLAIYAAQGWPKANSVMDAALYKSTSITKVGETVEVLKWSRITAGAATLLLVGVAVLSQVDTLAASAPSSSSVVVVHKDGTVTCVKASSAASLSDVVQAVPVDHC